MSAQAELWRVNTPEGVFEADLETLKQWISEGAVIPTDKVSKGNLNWIEAGRAPMLRTAFSNKAANIPYTPPAQEKKETTPASAIETPFVGASTFDESTAHQSTVPFQAAIARPASNTCQNHPEVKAHYICRVCAATFCETCPRFVNKIALCAACGDLCKPFSEVQSKAVRQEFQSSSFGFSDFGTALRYPFQHKIALLFGAAFYGILLLGGLKGQLLAFVIVFGCISQVISQVAWGRLNRSFMPDLSAFSMWDDFAVPLGLGIGIIIVTWGPTIVLMLVLIFGVLGGVPHGPSLTPAGPAASSSPLSSEDLGALTDPEADPKKLEEANKKLNQTRPGAQISAAAEKSKGELNDPNSTIRLLMPYLGAGIVILLLLLVTVLWGVFYGPMALAVAGYTQSFGSVINPLVGLDTIRRMRGTYFKAFGMVLLLQIIAKIFEVIIAVITEPLSLPFIGNLPATFIDGAIAFYFYLVIACLLGLSLHKCANRLGIEVD